MERFTLRETLGNGSVPTPARWDAEKKMPEAASMSGGPRLSLLGEVQAPAACALQCAPDAQMLLCLAGVETACFADQMQSIQGNSSPSGYVGTLWQQSSTAAGKGRVVNGSLS